MSASVNKKIQNPTAGQPSPSRAPALQTRHCSASPDPEASVLDPPLRRSTRRRRRACTSAAPRASTRSMHPPPPLHTRCRPLQPALRDAISRPRRRHVGETVSARMEKGRRRRMHTHERGGGGGLRAGASWVRGRVREREERERKG